MINALTKKTEQVAALQQRVQELEAQTTRIRMVEAELASLKELLNQRNAAGDQTHAAVQTGK